MHEYQYKIKQEAYWRGITKLYHFTPARNARSILCNGLVSRNVLLAHGIDFYATDMIRLDNRLDAVSLSIHSINETMFEAKKRDLAGEWLIFELDASILWTHNCRFCWTNASKSEILHHAGFLGGPWAFGQMFEDRPINAVDNRSYRNASMRADCQPTDNAAEVQVVNHILPDRIVDVTVRSQRVKSELEALMLEVNQVRPVVINEEIFR